MPTPEELKADLNRWLAERWIANMDALVIRAISGDPTLQDELDEMDERHRGDMAYARS